MTTYNPKDKQLAFKGIPVTGYAEGDDVIDIDYNADGVTTVVGATGEAAHIESNDRSAVVTIKLLATSAFNDVMSGFFAGNIEFATSLTDARGTSVAGAPSCRVMKLAKQTDGVKFGTREWKVTCAEMIANVGGTTA